MRPTPGQRLRTREGRHLHKRRGATAEPGIGNLKKIIDRFSRRPRQRDQRTAPGTTAFNINEDHRAAPAPGPGTLWREMPREALGRDVAVGPGQLRHRKHYCNRLRSRGTGRTRTTRRRPRDDLPVVRGHHQCRRVRCLNCGAVHRSSPHPSCGCRSETIPRRQRRELSNDQGWLNSGR